MTENTGRHYEIRIMPRIIVRITELNFDPEIQAGSGGTAK